MPSDSNSDNSERIHIGRIPLKQVRVRKSEPSHANPMNRLVPYLDLFCRLDDEELARLAGCDEDVVATLRKQVVAIDRALARYVDLLPRLEDEELVRLAGATPKTIRFWRLCQPRVPPPRAPDLPEDGVVARGASSKAATAPLPAAMRTEPNPSDSFTRGVRPSDSQRLGVASPDESYASEETGKFPTPADVQGSAKKFMQFSGEPFPGFEDGGTPLPSEAEWVPAPEDVEIEALTDDLLDDPHGV